MANALRPALGLPVVYYAVEGGCIRVPSLQFAFRRRPVLPLRDASLQRHATTANALYADTVRQLSYYAVAARAETVSGSARYFALLLNLGSQSAIANRSGRQSDRMYCSTLQNDHAAYATTTEKFFQKMQLILKTPRHSP